MRVLLDECLPRRLKHGLPGHEVATVPEMGWAGLTDRELIRLAESTFDVFVTMDHGLRYQQNLAAADIAVIVLVAPSNRLDALRPLMPKVLAALSVARAGEMVSVGG